MSVAPGYQQAAWSWSRHLRAGGSTTWTEWVAAGVGADDPPPPGWSVPGAAQLELVRLMAGRDVLDPTTFGALADLVTSRTGPGRGLGQQPLRWPGEPGRRIGTPPTDPCDIPADELVRVGVGALTELLLVAPGRDEERPSARWHRRWRRPSFELGGPPVTTSVVRGALGAAGHREGGRTPRVVLFAAPFDDAIAQVWSGRVQHGASVRWHGFVERWSRRAELPPSTDLPGLARLWADRVGTGRVLVLVTPDGPEAAARSAAELLGAPPRLSAAAPAEVTDLSPAAVDVLRRVNAVLGVRAPEDRRAAVRRELVATLARSTPTGRRLTLPRPFWDWARGRAERLADQLGDGGYPVHGRLEDVVPGFEGLPTHPRRQDALTVVVEACLGQASTNQVRRSSDR